MNLPDLPKQNKHQEADFGVQLKHHIEKTNPPTSSLEIKDTRGKNTFYYKELKPEQIAFALAISSDKGAWIRTLGLNGEPDYVWLRNEPAYIIIKYPKFYCFITVGNFLHEKESNKRKSLTSERAKAISIKTISL